MQKIFKFNLSMISEILALCYGTEKGVSQQKLTFGIHGTIYLHFSLLKIYVKMWLAIEDIDNDIPFFLDFISVTKFFGKF